MLSHAQRFEEVAKRRLCYHCLNKGHGIQNCKFHPDRTCGVDGCTAKHHKLVHRPKHITTLLNIEEFLEAFEDVQEEDDVEIQKNYFSTMSQTFLTGNLEDTTHTNLLPLESEFVSISGRRSVS